MAIEPSLDSRDVVLRDRLRSLADLPLLSDGEELVAAATIADGRAAENELAALGGRSAIDLNVASALKAQPDLETLLTEGDARITDLVFISPIEAFFFYDLDAPYGPVTFRFGRARLVDGSWRITRGTYCQEITQYGAFCGV